MVDVFLYHGEAVKNNVRLANPTVVRTTPWEPAPFTEATTSVDDATLDIGSLDNFVDTATVADALADSVGKTLADSATASDVCTPVLTPGGLFTSLSDSSTPADARIDAVGKALADSAVSADARIDAVGKVLADSAVSADARIDAVGKVLADLAVSSDARIDAVGKKLADSATTSEQMDIVMRNGALMIHRAAAGGLQLTGDISIQRADFPITSDSATLDVGKLDTLVDGVTTNDSCSPVLNGGGSHNNYSASPTDAASTSEVPTLDVGKLDQFVDGVTASDHFSAGLNVTNWTKNLNETQPTGDYQVVRVQVLNQMVDSVHVVDSCLVVKNVGIAHSITLNDSVHVTDQNHRVKYTLIANSYFLSISEGVEILESQTHGVNIATMSHYQRLNYLIRSIAAAHLTTPIMYTDEPGNQTKPFMTLDVRVDSDLQVELPVTKHETRGTVRFNIFIDPIAGDADATATMNNIYTTFRRLTYQGVIFYPPRIAQQSDVEYSCLVPFRYHV